MSLSKLDSFFRRLILTKFYTRGWGKPEDLRKILELHKTIANRESCCGMLKTHNYPVTLGNPILKNDCTIIDGHFISPICDLTDLVPEECKTARFQLVLPPRKIEKSNRNITVSKRKLRNSNLKPMCLHMAGTGDHGYYRRRELFAKPLLKRAAISSILLENPYYGTRKPKEQTRSGLLHVKDLFIMGAGLILEAQVLLDWVRKEGYGPLGLTGISMGGHMASLAATNWPDPIALIPCMSWTSSSVVWTEGVLSKAIPWRVLETQYAKDPAYETQINEIIKQNLVDSYELGREYVKNVGSLKPESTTEKTTKQSGKLRRKDKDDADRRQKQTLLFMKGVMDQMTDLQNFSVPVDPTLVTYVIAKADAYYPINSLRPMNEVWPGCEVRLLNTGHIAGFLMHHVDFCTAIMDTFDRFIDKYHSEEKPDKIDSDDANDESVGLDTKQVSSKKNLTAVQCKEDSKFTSSSKALYESLRVFTVKS